MWHVEMNQTNAAVVLAVMVGAAACLSGGDDDGKDTGFDFDSGYSGGWYDSGGSDGGGGGSGGIGDATGSYYLVIYEFGCTAAWSVAGTYTGSGYDYRWDANLFVDVDNGCGVSDTYGTIELSRGSAYFDGDYIGTVSYGSSYANWETAGYVTGSGGYSYAYFGSLAW